jgi:predicted RND superfamily exporter protein
LQIRIESALDTVLPTGDPTVEYYNQTRATFGSDDVGVVGVLLPDGPGDILAPATLEKLHRLSIDLGKLPGVEHVYSLTTLVDIADATSGVTPRKLLPTIPPAPADLTALRAKLDESPFYRKNLISDDYRGTAITVFFKSLSDADYERSAVDDQIMALLDRQTGPEQFFFTSPSHIKQEAAKHMRHDIYRFIPLSMLVVVVTLWLSFRTKRGVLMPLLSVVTALVWTLGIMVLSGHTITLGTFVLPGLILVIGSSYAIHVMARYYEQTEGRTDRIEVVVRAFERVWVPLLISALTTAIGFGSLMVNRIPAIFELGAFAVVGVVCLAVTTLLPLPASLAILPIERAAQRAKGGTPLLARLLSRIGWAVSYARKPILWGAMIVAAGSILMLRQIQVDADYLYYFTPSARVRVDYETINNRIVGSSNFYIVIDGEPGTIKRWEVLKLVKDLQSYLRAQPGITSTSSIVDVLEELERGVRRATGELTVTDAGEIVPAEPPKSF